MAKIYDIYRYGRGVIMPPKATSVFDVANYFLKVVNRDAGGSITHLKLQKLVYYAQAWHLVFTGKPLFPEKLLAWVHGPVCVELYNKYRDLGFQNLEEPAEKIHEFTEEEKETLDAVWECYGDFDGKYLEELSHQESPWQEARIGLAPGEHCNNEISLDLMKQFYTKLNQHG